MQRHRLALLPFLMAANRCAHEKYNTSTMLTSMGIRLRLRMSVLTLYGPAASTFVSPRRKRSALSPTGMTSPTASRPASFLKRIPGNGFKLPRRTSKTGSSYLSMLQSRPASLRDVIQLSNELNKLLEVTSGIAGISPTCNFSSAIQRSQGAQHVCSFLGNQCPSGNQSFKRKLEWESPTHEGGGQNAKNNVYQTRTEMPA